MHLAETLRLSDDDRAALFYSELLKDAGCTAYTSQLAALWLADELVAKRDLQFFRDAANPLDVLAWAARYVAADAALPTRAGRILDFVRNGRAAMREGFEATCQMASRVAERLTMPVAVQQALLHVFEQWDGKGMPNGARGSTPATRRRRGPRSPSGASWPGASLRSTSGRPWVPRPRAGGRGRRRARAHGVRVAGAAGGAEGAGLEQRRRDPRRPGPPSRPH